MTSLYMSRFARQCDILISSFGVVLILWACEQFGLFEHIGIGAHDDAHLGQGLKWLFHITYGYNWELPENAQMT